MDAVKVFAEESCRLSHVDPGFRSTALGPPFGKKLKAV
jgi:hypothetical protein